MSRLWTIVCAGTIALVLSSAASADQVWRIRGGTAHVSFLKSRMARLGITVSEMVETAKPVVSMEHVKAFAIDGSSTLDFVVRDGIFAGWVGGEIRHRGQFTLEVDGVPHSIADWSIVFQPGVSESELVVMAATSAAPAQLFDLRMPMNQFDRSEQLQHIGCMDILISRDFALKIQRPELEGELIGIMTLVAETALWQAGDDDDWRDPLEDGFVDLELTNIGLLTALGREGSFPNGVNGLSMSTTICNVGTKDAEWFAPMDTRHPMIVMNVFRIEEGRFEHIGVSGVKHGFFATNQSCGPCDHPGTSSLLGPNCSDTYGVGNNGDRNWLGPRSEVSAFKGTWQCEGSFFSGGKPDCQRRNNGDVDGPVELRIAVLDQDLNRPGATFLYEAYYIDHEDDLRANNIVHKFVRPTFRSTDQTWRFTDDSGLIGGPAIRSFGEKQSLAMPLDIGDVHMSVQTTELPNGNYRYDYAVFNFDLDPGLKHLSIPVRGAGVRAFGFHDTDQDAGNDWTASIENGVLSWTSPPKPNLNLLTYATAFSFWIEAEAAPEDVQVDLGVYFNSPGVLRADTLGPKNIEIGVLPKTAPPRKTSGG